MKALFSLGVLSLSLSSAAYADPVAAAGTETLCSGYSETIEGVWLSDDKPVLLFRFASERNGPGCYTVLNAYAPWGVGAPEEIGLPNVKWDGSRRDSGAVLVDLSSGTAQFNFNGARAQGVILTTP